MTDVMSRAILYGNLRKIWMRSPERSARMKLDKYTCRKCHTKASVAKGKEFKVQVHHKKGIDVWNEIMKLIREHILVGVDELETLCKECHKEEHGH